MQDYQKLWDDRYGGGKYIFGEEPNEYFKNKLNSLASGSIYLPGDGEGRNAIFAAEKGWDVTSVDFSEVAINRAKEFASLRKVNINFQFANLITDNISQEEYDVVGVSFLHFNGKNKEIVHRKLKNSLKIGGYLILECFSTDQIKLNSGGPRKKDSLYSVDELMNYYQGFEFIETSDTKTQLNEGEGHIGDAYVVRLFAKKIG
ncbi:MAG: class I SAM-dependent methyltransferase [Melioribacteraceae bacterium]|jgi:SAM-dependent methyltransferase|nr:class I SAM-dependent methyltransferase [Melioribacteraceae bacterium]